MPVQVFSGIKPPNELVEDMLRRQGTIDGLGGRPYTDTLASTHVPIATQSPLTSPYGVQFAPNITHPAPSEVPADDGAPPPSYEDAMAEDLAPVDGQRRDYEHPVPAPTPDEKRVGLFGEG